MRSARELIEFTEIFLRRLAPITKIDVLRRSKPLGSLRQAVAFVYLYTTMHFLLLRNVIFRLHNVVAGLDAVQGCTNSWIDGAVRGAEHRSTWRENARRVAPKMDFVIQGMRKEQKQTMERRARRSALATKQEKESAGKPGSVVEQSFL